jgi:predicted ATPase
MENVRIIEAEIDGSLFPLSPPIIKNNQENYFTVVIGNNATGKSRLLVNILNTLRQISNLRLRSKGLFNRIRLTLNDEELILDNTKSEENQIIAEQINLISISNSLFDKFPHQAKSDLNYSYIGSRMVGISTHRRSIVNDLMDILSENLDNREYVQKAIQLFDFLQIPPVITLALRLSDVSRNDKLNRLLENSRTPLDIKNFLIEISNQGFYRQQSKGISRIVEDDAFLLGFTEYIQTELIELLNNSKERGKFSYEIDLLNSSKNEAFIKEYKYFSVLRRLNFLNYDYIQLNKNGFEYDILDSSTGEIGLLLTFLRAIPELKSNSVIFIDEPEISLHPSWQMKYIDLLKSFLLGYSGCHIIIATHSHLLLSDLNCEWSSVLTLKNLNGNIIAKLKDYAPFGWSPEAILYDVFNVVNVRNHYFENDLRILLSLISEESKDYNAIMDLVNKFKGLNYKTGDPIELIITEAESYAKR